MLIVYDSLTGLGKQFAEKLGYETCDVNLLPANISQDIFLVTRSYNFGNAPSTTIEFLLDFKEQVCGLAVTGDSIWGKNYGKAGYLIQDEFKIPLIHVFERSGFPSDVDKVKEWIDKHIEETNKRKQKEGLLNESNNKK